MNILYPKKFVIPSGKKLILKEIFNGTERYRGTPKHIFKKNV